MSTSCFNMKLPYIQAIVDRFGEMPARAILVKLSQGELPNYDFIPKDLRQNFENEFKHTGNWEVASNSFLKSFTLRENRYNDGSNDRVTQLYRHNTFFPQGSVKNLYHERMVLSAIEDIAKDVYEKTGTVMQIVPSANFEEPIKQVGEKSYQVNWEYFRDARKLSDLNVLRSENGVFNQQKPISPHNDSSIESDQDGNLDTQYNELLQIGKYERINGFQSFLQSKGWKSENERKSLVKSMLDLLNENMDKFSEHVQPIRTAMFRIPEMTKMMVQYTNKFGKSGRELAVIHGLGRFIKGFRTGGKLDELFQNLQDDVLKQVSSMIGENVTLSPHAILQEIYELSAALDDNVQRNHPTMQQALLASEIDSMDNEEENDFLEDSDISKYNPEVDKTLDLLKLDFAHQVQFGKDIEALQNEEQIEYGEGETTIEEKYPGFNKVMEAYMPYVKTLSTLSEKEISELTDYLIRETSTLHDISDGYTNNGSLLHDMKESRILTEEDNPNENNDRVEAMNQVESGKVEGEKIINIGDKSYPVQYSMKGRIMELSMKNIPDGKIPASVLKDILEQLSAKLRELYDFSALKIGSWIKKISNLKEAKDIANLFFNSGTFQDNGKNVIIPVTHEWNRTSTSEEVVNDQVDSGRPTAAVRSRTKFYARRLARKFGLKVEFTDQPGEEWSGRWDPVTGTAIINLANVHDNTAIHEVLHPIVDVLENQNKELYDYFAQQAVDLGYWEKADKDELNSNTDKEAIIMMLTDYAQANIQADNPTFVSKIREFFEWLKSILFDSFGQEMNFRNLSLNTTMSEFVYKLFDPSTRTSLPADYESYGEAGYQKNTNDRTRWRSPYIAELQRRAEEIIQPLSNSFDIVEEQVYEWLGLGSKDPSVQLVNTFKDLNTKYTKEEADAMTFQERVCRISWGHDRLTPYEAFDYSITNEHGEVEHYQEVLNRQVENFADYMALMNSVGQKVKHDTKGNLFTSVGDRLTNKKNVSSTDEANFVNFIVQREKMRRIWRSIESKQDEFLNWGETDLTRLLATLMKIPPVLSNPLANYISSRLAVMAMTDTVNQERVPEFYGPKFTHIFLAEAADARGTGIKTHINDLNKSDMFMGFMGEDFASLFLMDRTITDQHKMVQMLYGKILEAHRQNAGEGIEIADFTKRIRKDKDLIKRITYEPIEGSGKRFFLSDSELEDKRVAGNITEEQEKIGNYINRFYYEKHFGYQTKNPMKSHVKLASGFASLYSFQFKKDFGMWAGRKLYKFAKPEKRDSIAINISSKDKVLSDAIIKVNPNYKSVLPLGHVLTLGQIKKTIYPGAVTYDAVGNPNGKLGIDEVISVLKIANNESKKQKKLKVDANGNAINQQRREFLTPGFGENIAPIYRDIHSADVLGANMIAVMQSFNLNNVMPFTRFVLDQYKDTDHMASYLGKLTDQKIFKCYQDQIEDEKGLLNKFFGYVGLSVLGLNMRAQILNAAIGTANNLTYHPRIVMRSLGKYMGLLVSNPRQISKYFNVMHTLHIGTVKNELPKNAISKFWNWFADKLFIPVEWAEGFNQMQLFMGMVTKEEMDDYNQDGSLKRDTNGKPLRGISGQAFNEISGIIRQVHGDYGMNRPMWSYNAIGKMMGMFRFSWMQTVVMNHYAKRMTDITGTEQVGIIQSAGNGLSVLFHFNRLHTDEAREKFYNQHYNDSQFSELKRIIDKKGKGKGSKISWEDFSERDKTNIRSFVRELIITAGLSMFKWLYAERKLKEMLQRDGKTIDKSQMTVSERVSYGLLEFASYMTGRLLQDVAFPMIPFSPLGYQNVAKPPAPLDFAERVVECANLWRKWDRYDQTGQYAPKGELKAINATLKLLPGGSIIPQFRATYRWFTDAVVNERKEAKELKKQSQTSSDSDFKF